MIRNRWLLSSSRVPNESVKRICSINENNNIKLCYNLIKCRKPLRPETTSFFLWESSVFKYEQIKFPAHSLIQGNWRYEDWKLKLERDLSGDIPFGQILLLKYWNSPKNSGKTKPCVSWAHVPIHIYVDVWQGVLWDIIDA